MDHLTHGQVPGGRGRRRGMGHGRGSSHGNRNGTAATVIFTIVVVVVIGDSGSDSGWNATTGRRGIDWTTVITVVVALASLGEPG